MALDGIVIRALRTELLETILGGRIEKVYQPLSRDVILLIRNRGKSYKLLLSANATFPRVLLAERYDVQNPPVPPMFCMLMRKHVEGGLIRDIVQVSNERILHIVIEATDELGERLQRTVIVEVMGRHSNVILLDPANQTIIDSIVHVTHATSRYREVLPGRQYVSPPAQEGKRNPFELTNDTFRSLRQTESEQPFPKFLVNHLLGVSPVLAKELANQADMDVNGPQMEWQILSSYLERWKRQEYHPTVRIDGQTERPLGFSVLPLTHILGENMPFASISTCMEWFYLEKVRYDTIHQKAGDLLRVLKTERDRNATKVEKLYEEIEVAKDAEQFRLIGELITASIHQIKRGDALLTTVNYYEESMPVMEIELDPQLTPSENAQAYFRKYNKKKQSIPHLEQQIQIAKEEIRYIEEVMVQIEHASYHELDDIREELQQQGYVKKKEKTNVRKQQARSNKGKANKQPAILLERYRSPEGVEIIVGKNNKQNDYLSTKLASKNDTWLHTKDIPGSHVVIRAKEFSEQTLQLAAQLAAYYSKGRESNQVPVDYTLVKHIWKPNGAKPGLILYENQHTLFVKPTLEGLEPLGLK